MIDLAEAGTRFEAFNLVPIAEAEIIRAIRENSAKGVDYKGGTMAPYVQAYKKYRAKKGLSVNVVTLRVKPEDSFLDLLGEQEPGVITVPASKEGQAQGLANKRDYMGVSQGAIARMEERFVEEFERMFS